MKVTKKTFTLLSLIITTAGMLHLFICLPCESAQDDDYADVIITVQEIVLLDVSGDPGTLTITEPASAGDLPADATDNSSSISWTSTCEEGLTRKLTGSIDDLFSGVNLYAAVSDNGSTGASTGQTQFAAASTSYDFVTGISGEAISDNTITYKAEVSSMTAPYTNSTSIVTWTLTDDS